MHRETFSNTFHKVCSHFKQHECIKFIADRDETMTYAELESMTGEMNQLFKTMMGEAKQLIGIVCRNLDPEAVAVMMGVVEARTAFVFVDIFWKNMINVIDRLNIRFFVCEETCVFNCLQILDAVVREDFSSTKILKKYRILERRALPNDQSTIDLDIAFVAFTSGSTGRPKPIRVSFSSIVPNILDLRNIYNLQISDTIYIATTPTFDPCILDVFLGLSSGCRLLLAATNVKFDLKILSNIFSNVATICYITPSVFVKTFPKNLERTSLKILTFGGEPFPNLDSAMYPCLENVNVYNIYGITEVSCWASIDLVVDHINLSLGTPLSDTIFEVRDRGGEVISEGIGELFIGSNNRICILEDDNDDIQLVKPCFRASGDIVEVKGGRFFYVGRTDRNVKILGHRVDLASIDSKLCSHAAVQQCRSIFLREENLFVIFVVLSSNDITAEDIEAFLKQQFPSHAIPSKIFLISEFPLNEHGKVCDEACAQLYHSLNSQCERNLNREFEILWEKYTSVTNNGDMGFIECGGNSILALQFTTALKNVSRVPNDFIVALLSNVKYSRCLALISPLTDIESVGFSMASTKRCLTEVGTDESKSQKTIKLEGSFGRLKGVINRGNNQWLVDGDGYPEFSKSTNGNLKVKWEHDMGKCVDASPTVLIYEKNSVVVCGSHSGQLLLTDLRSGNILAKVVLPDRIESSACASSCGTHIFIGCYDHKVYCISVQESSIEWAFETEDMVKSSPVYFDEKLFFGSYDHYFYCLSREGELQWKTNIDESSIYATAIVQENIIVVATLGGTIALLEHDGRIKFRICYEKPFFSSPCAITDDLFVIIDVAGFVRLLNTISGEQIWQYQVEGNVFSSVSHFTSAGSNECHKIVFGCHDKRIYCLTISEKTADLCWRVEVSSPVYATPFCYPTHANSMVCAATTSGDIYVVDADDGSIIKSCTMNGHVFSSPVVVEAIAIFGCRNNYLYALDIS